MRLEIGYLADDADAAYIFIRLHKAFYILREALDAHDPLGRQRGRRLEKTHSGASGIGVRISTAGSRVATGTFLTEARAALGVASGTIESFGNKRPPPREQVPFG